MGVSLSSVFAVQGYGFDKDYEIVDFDMPFLFSYEADAVDYVNKLKRIADKLASFYSSKLYEDHWGGVELTNEEYELFEKRAEYWAIRSSRVWVKEFEVR